MSDETLALQNKNNSQKPSSKKFWEFLKSQRGWLFVLPAVVLMAIFTFYPIVNAFIGAFKENYQALHLEGEKGYTGWGFENFVRVLKGDTGTGGASFIQCLFNTFVFTFISVPLSTLLALLISVGLTRIKVLQKAYQTVFFLPYLTNALAMGAVFATFFTIVGTSRNVETYGLMNNFLGLFGIKPVDWIGSGSPAWHWGSLNVPWAKYIVAVIYEVWSGLPFKILILFSALQNVNKQYYDAAKIDGASKNTVLWKITAPLISPMLSYLLITGLMGGMKQYSAIVGIFGADMGIDYDMGTMVGYIYQYIEKGATGFAFAGSLLLFAVIMVFTGINLIVSKKTVHY
jgi:multiple sugar transport system permease protein